MAKKKKAPPAEKENSERWLVSYSDFVTLLLGVFIIMYSMAAADAEKAGGAAESESKFIAALAGAFGNAVLSENSGDTIIDLYSGGSLTEGAIEERTMQELKETIEEYVEENLGITDDSIEVVVDELGVHISIKDRVLFNSGSHILNVDAIPIITKIGDMLKASFINNYIQVQGYTDNVPMSGDNPYVETNWELGSLRAVNVLRMLVEKCALNPNKIAAISYGEFQPVDTNKTIEGRAKNRRVEIIILRNYAFNPDAEN